MNRYFFTILTMAKVFTRRYFRDRTSLFFTILFPIILLVLFGSLFGGNNSISINIALINRSNSSFSQTFIHTIKDSKVFSVSNIMSVSKAEQQMNQGRLDGLLILPSSFGAVNKSGTPTGTVQLLYNPNNAQAAQAIQSALNGYLGGINTELTKVPPPFSVVTVSTNKKSATSIDYIFPGIIGFTIITLGLLGPTRLLPSYKKEGILRRYHTTPVTVVQFVIASVLSYLAIGLVAIVVLFFIATNFYHFSMTGNYIDLVAFLALSITTIYGFGLAIGGWAKDEQRAAPLTNLVSYPMMFLSGAFFPTYIMPQWLQNITHYIPLSPVIEGARLIMTDNKSLFHLGSDVIIILGWLVVIYLIAFKAFSWES